MAGRGAAPGAARGRAARALDGRPFPTRPFYAGDPWFLPLLIARYDLRDRLAC